MKTLIVLLIFAFFLFSACENDVIEKSNMDLLTENTWHHDTEIIDLNQNQQPDDENGDSKSISFNFKSDGSLVYITEDTSKTLSWQFEDEDNTIRIIGIMNDSIIPPVDESIHDIFELTEDELIFYYMSAANHPETGCFDIYRHN